MIRYTGLEKDKKPENKEKSSLGKLFNPLVSGAGKLASSAFNKVKEGGYSLTKALGFTAAGVVAGAVVLPPFHGAYVAATTAPNPHVFDYQTNEIFWDTTFNGWKKAFNLAGDAAVTIGKGADYIYGEAKPDTSEPDYILVCKPSPSIRAGHATYYNKLDDDLQKVLVNRHKLEQIQGALDRGYTPIIKYNSPWMKSDSPFSIEYPSEPGIKPTSCGSASYSPKLVPLIP